MNFTFLFLFKCTERENKIKGRKRENILFSIDPTREEQNDRSNSMSKKQKKKKGSTCVIMFAIFL